MKTKQVLAILMIVLIGVVSNSFAEKVDSKEFSFRVFGFKKGSSEITPDMTKRLKEIVENIPENAEVRIIGWSDKDGTQKINKKLSLERALKAAEKVKLLNSNELDIRYRGAGVSENFKAKDKNRSIQVVIKVPTNISDSQFQGITQSYAALNKSMNTRDQQMNEVLKDVNSKLGDIDEKNIKAAKATTKNFSILENKLKAEINSQNKNISDVGNFFATNLAGLKVFIIIGLAVVVLMLFFLWLHISSKMKADSNAVIQEMEKVKIVPKNIAVDLERTKKPVKPKTQKVEVPEYIIIAELRKDGKWYSPFKKNGKEISYEKWVYIKKSIKSAVKNDEFKDQIPGLIKAGKIKANNK